MAVLNYFSENNNEIFNDNLSMTEDLFMSMDCLGNIGEYFSTIDNFIPDLSYDISDNLFQNLNDIKSEDTFSTYDLNAFDQINNFISDENYNYNEINYGREESGKNDELINLDNFRLSDMCNMGFDLHDSAKCENNLKKFPEVIVLKKLDHLKNVSNFSTEVSYLKNQHTSNDNIQYTKSVLLRSQNNNHIQINNKNKTIKEGQQLTLNSLKVNKINNYNTFSKILSINKKNMEQKFPQKSLGINFISKKLNFQKLSNSMKNKTIYVKRFPINHSSKSSVIKIENCKLPINKFPLNYIYNKNINNLKSNTQLNVNSENFVNLTLNNVDLNKNNQLNKKLKESNKDFSKIINRYKLNFNLNKKDIYQEGSNKNNKQDIFFNLVNLKECTDRESTKCIDISDQNDFEEIKKNKILPNDSGTNELKILNMNNIKEDSVKMHIMETQNIYNLGTQIKTNEVKQDIDIYENTFTHTEKTYINEVKDQDCKDVSNKKLEGNLHNSSCVYIDNTNIDLHKMNDSINNSEIARENIFDKCDISMRNEILNLMQEAEIQLIEDIDSELYYDDIFTIGQEIEIGNFNEIGTNEMQIDIGYTNDRPKKKLSFIDYKNLKKRKLICVDTKKAKMAPSIEMYDYSFTDDHTYHHNLVESIKPEEHLIKNEYNEENLMETENLKVAHSYNKNIEQPVISYSIEMEVHEQDKSLDSNSINDLKQETPLLNCQNMKTEDLKIDQSVIACQITKPSLKSQMLIELSMKKKNLSKHKKNRVNIVPSPIYSDDLNNYLYGDLSSISSNSESEDFSECRNVSSRKIRINRASSEESEFSRSSSRSHSSYIINNENQTKNEAEKQWSHMRAVNERRIVYVGNLPNCFTKYDLEKSLRSFGHILKSSVHYKTNKRKFGFVTFSKSSEAEDARQNGHLIPGCKKFDFNYGGRRDFCQSEYLDLDNDHDSFESNTNHKRDIDTSHFQNLLYDTLKMLKKRK